MRLSTPFPAAVSAAAGPRNPSGSAACGSRARHGEIHSGRGSRRTMRRSPPPHRPPTTRARAPSRAGRDRSVRRSPSSRRARYRTRAHPKGPQTAGSGRDRRCHPTMRMTANARRRDGSDPALTLRRLVASVFGGFCRSRPESALPPVSAVCPRRCGIVIGHNKIADPNILCSRSREEYVAGHNKRRVTSQ
jgi:hypothetical protein